MDDLDWQKLLDIERAERDRQRIMRLNSNTFVDEVIRQRDSLVEKVKELNERIRVIEKESK